MRVPNRRIFRDNGFVFIEVGHCQRGRLIDNRNDFTCNIRAFFNELCRQNCGTRIERIGDDHGDWIDDCTIYAGSCRCDGPNGFKRECCIHAAAKHSGNLLRHGEVDQFHVFIRVKAG